MPLDTKRRSVTLTNDEWTLYDSLGGAAWLRTTLGNMRTASVNRAMRRIEIRRMVAAGYSDIEIATKFNIDRTTVWRMR